MINLDEIRAHLKCKALIAEVDLVPKGHVRIETTFKYPDGASIDLFVVNDPEEPLLPPSVLSDLGQTTSWLLDLQVKPWLSKKRAAMVEDVLRVYGARQNGGAIEIRFGSSNEIEPKIVTLAQACLRISDLTFTRRSSLQAEFSTDLEEVLIDCDVPYESNVEIPGRFGAPVRVDYLAHGQRRDSALMGWSSGNTSQAHVVANEIFRRWYDIDTPRAKLGRVTVFDDRYDVYRKEDMDRIREYSDLVAFSERHVLNDLLLAVGT